MARRQIDIALSDNDLHITAGGDFAAVESSKEHMRQLVQNGKGDFKENPAICVGAEQYIDDDGGFGALVTEISRQFSGDGMAVQLVSINANGTIESKAEYI